MNAIQRFSRWLLGTPRTCVIESNPHPPFTAMTIKEWRESEVRVKYAETLFSDPNFIEMVGALNYGFAVREPSDASLCGLELGRALGRQEVLTALNFMRVPAPKTEVIHEEPTYPNPTLEE